MRKLKIYVRAMRVHWSCASALGALIGLTFAWEAGYFSALWAVGVWIMLVSCHTAMQVWDELVDYREYRAQMYEGTQQKVETSFSGGSGVLTNGELSYREMLGLFAVLMSVFLTLAAYAVYLVGIELVFLYIAGLLWAMGYSAPPLKLSYRGLGEVGMLLVMGPLLVLMFYFATVRVVAPEAAFSISARHWLLCLVPGFISFAQMFWGQVIDLEEDREANKRNLSVRFGIRTTLQLQVAALVLCALIIAGLSVQNPWLLPTLAILLFGLKEALWVLENRDDRDAVQERHKRHPLYRTSNLSSLAIVFGLVAHGLATRDVSAAGAVCLVGLACLSWSLGWRFYLPGLGLETKPSVA